MEGIENQEGKWKEKTSGRRMIGKVKQKGGSNASAEGMYNDKSAVSEGQLQWYMKQIKTKTK